MTPKEKERVMHNLEANNTSTIGDYCWATPIHDGVFANVKHRNGVLMLDLAVDVGRDNKQDRRAKKLADKHARSFFKRPRFVLKSVIHWEDRMPVFRYREQMYR